MQIMTHKLFGELLFTAVTEVYGGLLNRQSFINGNLLPDLDSRYMAFRHYPHDCWMYLTRLTREMDQAPYHPERSSQRLGVLCHFIADSFCRVHNRPYTSQCTMWGHMLYEHRLHQRTKLLIKEGLVECDDFQQIIHGPTPGFEHWIHTHFPTLHGEYLAGEPDIERDIRWAIHACREMCLDWAARETQGLRDEAIA